MKRRQPSVAINLVERALIAREWRENVATARIHALMGENAEALVDQAGRVYFVVLAAAIAVQTSTDLPEMRVIRGAINAIHDQSGATAIDPTRRASILSGLEAAVRLLPALPHAALVRSACELAAKLKRQDVLLSDFEALLGGAAA